MVLFIDAQFFVHIHRSSTFQLMRIAFDEEVTSESIEAFRKLVRCGMKERL